MASKSSHNRHNYERFSKTSRRSVVESDAFTVAMVDNIKVMLLCMQVLNIEAGMGQVCSLFSLRVAAKSFVTTSTSKCMFKPLWNTRNMNSNGYP